MLYLSRETRKRNDYAHANNTCDEDSAMEYSNLSVKKPALYQSALQWPLL